MRSTVVVKYRTKNLYDFLHMVRVKLRLKSPSEGTHYRFEGGSRSKQEEVWLP